MLACWGALAAQPAQGPDYRNAGLPIERRVADLLRRMTLEEKCAQLTSIWDRNEPSGRPRIKDDKGWFSPERAREVLRSGLGQVSRPGEGKGPREEAEFTNAVQKFVMENTRLGIPIMFHEEGLHGHMAPKGTHFPQAIALAGTWNSELVTRVFTAVAREMRARGVHQVLAPVLDLGRDPRWGRIEETYGEDPYLVARMAVAAIRGFQGDGPPYAGDRVMATAKHFAVHGQPEAGINVAPGNYSERVVREEFLYPFEAAVKEARVASVMPSYNEWDGVPLHANRYLLERVLRQEWGFQGFLVSDYFGITDLVRLHRVAADGVEAARKALEAGVDLELPFTAEYGLLAAAVREGRIRESLVDRAAARVLRAKFELGLFEHPYVDPGAAERIVNNEEHRALARRAALEALTLLKNQGGLLPLDRKKIKTLAVVGPNADKRLLGGYSDDPGYFITVLDGVRRKLGSAVKVTYAEGCKITTDDSNYFRDLVQRPDPEQNRRLMAEAVQTAAAADTVLLVLGGNEAVAREAWSVTHLGDMDTLELVGPQNELTEQILKLGKPVVVVLLGGKPYAITWLAENVPAILQGWYLGQETGYAVAEVLFGDYNPAGRLPVTVLRNVGQIPGYYYHRPSARRGYLLSDVRPLFVFGHGLSYTAFEYRNLRVTPPKIRSRGTATVAVEVRNTGKLAGDEVVQLYIRDEVSSVTRPVKQLRGFQRIHLKPGESRTVEFPIGWEALSMLDENMNRVVEPGTFEIMVGPNSVQTSSVKLEVIE